MARCVHCVKNVAGLNLQFIQFFILLFIQFILYNAEKVSTNPGLLDAQINKFLRWRQIFVDPQHGSCDVTNLCDLIMDKTPTHALFTQHYISLAC